MITKEDAHDYRYLPEPDLMPVVLDMAEVEVWRTELPELPDSPHTDNFLHETISPPSNQMNDTQLTTNHDSPLNQAPPSTPKQEKIPGEA